MNWAAPVSLRASAAALATQINKGQLDPERIKRDVQTMMERTNVLQETNRRVLLQRLSPAGLRELGLSRALQALAATWRQDQPGTALSLDVSGPLDGLDPTTTLTIYRIVQKG